MSYKDLYEYCQTLSVPVSRSHVKTKIAELSPHGNGIRIVKSTLNPELVQGYFLSAQNLQHRIVQQCGGAHVIVVARDLNYCWERFVVIKELMHLFDGQLDATNAPQEFETLLNEFTNDPGTRSPQMRAEIACFWMAIGIMCPEQLRLDLQRQISARTITDMDVAEMLKMPVAYVPALFNANYKANIAKFMKRGART